MSVLATSAAITRAELAERQRTYPDRTLRHVRRLIDWALGRVELVNLGGGGPAPSTVLDLVVHLQQLAGEPIVRPASSWEAHEALFRVAAVLLGLPEDEDDQLVERRVEGRC